MVFFVSMRNKVLDYEIIVLFIVYDDYRFLCETICNEKVDVQMISLHTSITKTKFYVHD